MQVTFRKAASRRLVEWEVSDRPRRTRARRTVTLGSAGLPHDLEQLVVEAAIGLTNGFWGSMASSPASVSTSPRLARSHGTPTAATPSRRDLHEAEHLVAVHVSLADQGRPTPAAAPLARFRRLWTELADDGELTVNWPSLKVLAPV